ncbi:hypothetical protein [Streptomyces bugieae]|uniref:Uncharacterized protein n=1 Tax=Streptomyces bugieae TaxID=3098223 RepID=A0ABU7NX57_9ACTN|nr:hypothetical protein [Streptomyces sp. DSM 41528]
MLFTELARALVQALDAWAAVVGQATDTDKRPTRTGLIAELERDRREAERLGQARRRIDEPLLAYWLKGRDQLLVGKKRNRLPSEEDSAAIAHVLAKKACRGTEQLSRLGREIADLARRLKDEGGAGWRNAVLASLVHEARPGEEVGAEHSTTSVTPLPTPGNSRGTPGSSEALPDKPIAGVSCTATYGEEASVWSPPAAGGHLPGAPRPDGRQRPLHHQQSWVNALGSVVAVVVSITAVITAAAVTASDDGKGAEPPSASAAPHTSPISPVHSGLARTAGLETPGLEKGVLGEDSRCSAPFQGPNVITWRVCARVDEEYVSFALKITNRGRAATTVKIRLEYAQTSRFHSCPKARNTHLLNAPAGKTVITDPRQCAVPREATPFAYQGVGWVVAEEANAGSYELAPTAHVYPDRVIWKPDFV